MRVRIETAVCWLLGVGKLFICPPKNNNRIRGIHASTLVVRRFVSQILFSFCSCLQTRGNFFLLYPTNLRTAGGSDLLLRFSNHTKDLARIALILTVDLPNQLESHFAVYLDVRNPLGGLKIAWNSLFISPLGDNLEEFPPHALALRIRPDGNDIAEIVALRVGPDFLLRLCLTCFPDPIPSGVEATVSQKPDVVEELAEREQPVLIVGIPALGNGRGMRNQPTGHSDDA